MIWKLGMLHQGLKLYNVNINDDPGLTSTYFTTRSNLVASMFEWGKVLPCYEVIYMKKKILWVVCAYPGAIYMYIINFYLYVPTSFSL